MLPKTSRPSLRGLRTFCVAARCESFSQAADELYITASAVSHQIKNLEAELGQELFERTGRSIRLSETGRSLYNQASPLVTELDELLLQFGNRSRRRPLRVSVQPFFASELFIPRLNDFIVNHPDIDLMVDSSDESSEQLPPSADVGIRLFRTPPRGGVRLFPLTLVPVGSPEFRDSVVVEDRAIVGPFPMIVHGTRPSAWRQWSNESGIRLPAESTTIRLDSMIAVARAAQRGIGAALVPAALSDLWFESRSLVPLFDHRLTSDDAYFLFSRDDKNDDPDVRALREWVLQIFASDC